MTVEVAHVDPEESLPQITDEDWKKNYASIAGKARGHLVKNGVGSRLHSAVDFDDLGQDGAVGVLKARRRYDSEKNPDCSFQTFAWYRARGEILDQLRNMHWLGRQECEEITKAANAMTALGDQLGREATYQEAADSIGMPIKRFVKALSNIEGSKQLSLDRPTNHKNTGADENELYNRVENKCSPCGLDELRKKEIKQAVDSAISELPEPFRQIAILHYFEDIGFSQIGEILGIPEWKMLQKYKTCLPGLLKKKLRGMREMVWDE